MVKPPRRRPCLDRISRPFDGAQGGEGIVAWAFDMPLEHCQARFKHLDLLFDRTRDRDHCVGPLPDRVVEIGHAEVRPYFAAATIQAGRRESSAKRRGRLIWRRSARIDKVAAISLLPELVGGAAEFLEYSLPLRREALPN